MGFFALHSRSSVKENLPPHNQTFFLPTIPVPFRFLPAPDPTQCGSKISPAVYRRRLAAQRASRRRRRLTPPPITRARPRFRSTSPCPCCLSTRDLGALVSEVLRASIHPVIITYTRTNPPLILGAQHPDPPLLGRRCSQRW